MFKFIAVALIAVVAAKDKTPTDAEKFAEALENLPSATVTYTNPTKTSEGLTQLSDHVGPYTPA